MRALLIRLVEALIALFYRRVELTGEERIPESGPVLLVANHVNGLVDPMLVLATVTRPVVFVAKSTLWKIPLLRTVLDVMGVVPVLRRVDVAAEGEPGGADRNAPSFERLAGVLRNGGVVLIFPEGRSHSDPSLSAVRTGAARILLLAGVPVTVLPVGLFFTKKEEFRSDVLLTVGERLEPAGEPDVEAWTRTIQKGLSAVTLNAPSWDEHEAARAVEVIYGEKLASNLDEAQPASPGSLDRAFRSRRLLLEARRVLERVEPGAVARLARRARAFARLLARAGLSVKELDGGETRTPLGGLFGAVAFPFALAGALAFYLPYRLCAVVARRLAGRKESLDQVSLMKILAGVFLFPSTYALEVGLLGFFFGLRWAAGAALLLPPLGLFALWFLTDENYRSFLGMPGGRGAVAYIRKERDELRLECDRLAELYAKAGDNRRP